MTIDLGRELQAMKARLDRMERSPRLSHASIDDTSVQVRDASGGLRGLLGVQADGTTAVNIVNGSAPPTPSTPTVAPALGGIAVGWDGTFADDAVIPLDWSRVEVHASITPGFTPTADTLQATMETPQGAISYLPADDPTYVRLLSRNTSGTPSTATPEVGPYSPRPVAGDIGIGEIVSTMISDGAVTTPKIFANAVTTAKLDVGSVDATALAADAITGKTITGGTITGSLIQTAASGERVTLNAAGLNKVLVHNSAGLAIGELSSNGLAVKGTNGSVLQLDPNNTFPNLRLTNPAGTNNAIINVSGAAALLGTNSGLFTDRGYTDMKWRNLQGGPATNEGFAVIEQVRDSNTSLVYGGRLYLDTDKATLGYVDTDDSTQNTTFFVMPNYAQLLDARLDVFPPASSGNALSVNTGSGHTGNLLRLAVNGTDKFVVDEEGNVTILGIGQRLFARKSADAPARTSTTPSADPHLAVTLGAPATYRLEGFLKWSGDSASDINLGWNTPASSAGSWVCYGGDAAMSAVPATMRIIDTAINSTRSYGVISTVTGQAIRGTVRTTTAGTLSLNWGAQTAGGTGISILTDSWIHLERVE